MSQTTHLAARISSPSGARRTAILAGLLGLACVAIVVIALTLGSSDANTADRVVSDQSASAIYERPADSSTRFDGGPEEGTRGPIAAATAPGTRFDGGPEEGTRGPAAAPSTSRDAAE